MLHLSPRLPSSAVDPLVSTRRATFMDAIIRARSSRWVFRYLQGAHGILHLLRERLVVVTGQSNPWAKRDPHVSRPRHVPPSAQYPVNPLEPDRHHGYVKARADHADARTEPMISPVSV